MLKKIVISRFNNVAAILQGGKVQEIVTISNQYQVNDIYVGTVHKIFTSINAAFIDLGNNKKSGFMHINDAKCLRKTHNLTRINDVLSLNQRIFVQVVKEPTLNKGPRLTANINLFGRYLVLMPFCDVVHVSRKIYDRNERSYFQALAVLLKPATMGLLIRSAASGINEEVLLEDLHILKQQWYFMQKLAVTRSFSGLLYRDEDLVKKIIRDFYYSNVQAIIVDSSSVLSQVRYYLNKWRCILPNSNIKLQVFKHSESILDKFNVRPVVIDALKPKVNLSIGGYLFIETYEAFTIIDVNSGSFNPSDNSKEAILRANCYAATEIAYQLKLRNINGVIIIDFIDMESHRDQLQLLEHFARILSLDNVRPQIIQLSKLGLVELTRRRRGQALFELFHPRYDNYSVSSLNLASSVTQDYIQNSDSLYHSINSLFFSSLVVKTICVSKRMIHSKNRIKVIDLKKHDFLQLRHVLTASLMLYSQIIDTVFRIK